MLALHSKLNSNALTLVAVSTNVAVCRLVTLQPAPLSTLLTVCSMMRNVSGES